MKTTTKLICVLLLVLSFLSTLFVVTLPSVSAVNMCAGSTLLNATINNPYAWTIPSAYIFNSTTNITRIDSACWIPSIPWEEITLVSKPFPNTCTSTYNAICTEDTDNYSTTRTYFSINTTKRYCVNTDNSNWRWTISNGGLQEIRNNYTQICSGGASSIDTSCRAPLYFNRTRNGAANYSSWNYTGTAFYVNQDVAAFIPNCYGAINGTVTDSINTPLSNVNVTLLLSGPGVEPAFNSTLTNSQGIYSFNSIPSTYYRVLFSKTNYNSEIVSTKVNYTNMSTVNAVLSSGSCNYDCTTQADPSRCSASCNGIAGCSFNSSAIATLLDGKIINTQIVINDAGLNYTISTCEGIATPYVAPTQQSAQISCPAGTNLIILERIVLYNGQPVKVIVPVCRSS